MRDRPGRDVSRIEGFSDAAFGFALTLLLASIEYRGARGWPVRSRTR